MQTHWEITNKSNNKEKIEQTCGFIRTKAKKALILKKFP